MARNAMPPPGDTDGAVRSDEAGEAPHSVVVLPATSEPVERDQSHSNLSSTLRPLVERERRERGDEDGAVGVAGRGTAASSTTRRRSRARCRRAVTVILGPRPMSRREELTCQRLRNAVQLWTTVYTEMGWCDDMRDKLRLHMLLHATCSHREVEPRFIRVWLQGPVLQDAAAANRRSCVRNVLTDMWLSRRIRTATTEPRTRRSTTARGFEGAYTRHKWFALDGVERVCLCLGLTGNMWL